MIDNMCPIIGSDDNSAKRYAEKWIYISLQNYTLNAQPEFQILIGL